MPIGERLREERVRLGLSQPVFAAHAGTTKQTLFSWESGKTAPNAEQLAALASAGVDVMFVLSGARAQPPLQAAEEALLQSYRRCNAAAQVSLLQTAALMAAGLEVQPVAGAAGTAVQVGNISSEGSGNVQVGYAGGGVKVSRSGK